jgi:lysophospholipase L1-like esterase
VAIASFSNAQAQQPSEEQLQIELAEKWKTIGFQQPNSMGGGEAAIPETGKFRVFILMGQSNMNGSGRAEDLEAPYNRKHERIRIWANGRWEYMVPRNKFGPGVSLAHQLADFWPDDTIGIVKVSCGATGISAFEKNWSFERAERSKDGKKGPMYKDLMNAVVEAKRISRPEFCGFVWKQASADGRKGLAEEYSRNLKQLISDLSEDLGVPNLPTFIPSYARDQELLKGILSRIDEEERLAAKRSAGKDADGVGDLLDAVLAYVDANGLFKNETPVVKKQRYLATVISAQNRLGRELSYVTTFYPGKLPIGDDGVHYSSEGYIMLGKATASAIEEFYKQ